VDFFSLSLILFLSSLIGIVHGLSKKDILKTPLPFAMHLVMGSLVFFSLY
jgi:predicted membrane chloride channel (bestrophin family)